MTATLEASKSTAFVFPGQGSQAVGMGKDLYLNSASAREVFDEVDDVLQQPLSDIMFNGPNEDLTRTENAQPAILTASIAAWRTLEEATESVAVPDMTAGHSLGEYSALVVAGVLSVSDAVKLVCERGRLMQLACDERPGGMAALIGIDEVTVAEICREAGVDMSTVNTPEQIIIAGEHRGLAVALDMASARGAKKAIPLSVGGAFHSGLMSPAQSGLDAAIESVEFQDPLVPIVGNVDAEPLETADDVKYELRRQLTSCVQWNNGIRHMLDNGVDEFVEMGNGKILSGMIRRIERRTKVVNLSDYDAVWDYAAA
ncbi:MAG: ACP S-malonyltransferase [Chloroflexi bacterium]|nr:ACP S-malonyltransferase [Chloroflexota bacterium]